MAHTDSQALLEYADYHPQHGLMKALTPLFMQTTAQGRLPPLANALSAGAVALRTCEKIERNAAADVWRRSQ
jgi:hypothetical protein